jgi:hypothetical protein
MKFIIVLFLILFYGNMIYKEQKISTFIFLFLFFPLCVSIGFYFCLPISYLYLFALSFIIQWILFLNVNTYPIANGNKFAIMSYIPDKYKPEQDYLLKNMNNQEIENLKFPIIMKPIVCSGGGNEINIFNSYSEFVDFIIHNEKKIDISHYMVQNYLEDYDIEIGILYERKPWEEKGRVLEFTEKTQKDKIRPQNINFLINHNTKITDKIHQLFDEISQKIPGFYVGRYDIRLRNLEDFEKGKFKIIEVNGTMGMYLISDDYLFNLNDFIIDSQWYWNRILFGGYNMATLKGYGPFNLLQVFLISLYRGFGCNTWENIFSLYS